MPDTPEAPPVSILGEKDETGLDRIATGSALGVAAAILAIIFPIVFLLFAAYAPGGFLALNQPGLLDAIGILIIAGAILYLLSLFIYRRAFAALRKVDERFWLASILCLIGTLGFLLLLIAAAVVIGSTNSLLSCVSGHPSHALTCLRSGEPLGAYTGLIGFWLGWLGGLGIVLGLSAGSSRFHNRRIGLGAALYALLLLILIGPFIALVVSFPGVEYILFLAPILSFLAPVFVFSGVRPILPE